MTPVRSSVDIAKLSRELQNAADGIDACDCGPDCKCDTISQNLGNCTCGKEMMEAKARRENGKF
jgi:hypothetical protein